MIDLVPARAHPRFDPVSWASMISSGSGLIVEPIDEAPQNTAKRLSLTAPRRYRAHAVLLERGPLPTREESPMSLDG